MEQQKELEDAMFWLPPEFLNDENDDVFISHSQRNKSMSSLEGSTATTETESDEEDYLNDLSRKLAYSTLEDTFLNNNSNFTLQNKSTEVMAGSPQSTLYGCKPAPGVNYNDFSLDVLYAAVGQQVAMLKMSKQNGFVNPNSQFQTVQLKQQRMMKQRQLQQQQQIYQQFVQENRGRNGVGGGGNMKPVAAASLSAWPTLQQSQQQQQQLPPGSGMRAVFLGNPNNPKRESTGTGVFLPRQIGAPIETRKKQGCSTVLLPDKVVHALNLNLEGQNRSNGGRFPPDYDAELRYRNNVLMAEQRWRQMEKDLRLPQEWTY